MAVTVTGKNYAIVSGCESMTDGGTWTFNKGVIDGGVVKQGTYSLVGILAAVGDNDAYVTKASDYWDCSGVKHLRCWVLTTVGGALNTDALGGLQLSVSDGTDTAYYYVSGKTTYPGGWYNLVVDLSRTEDGGTKPTDMSLVTRIGIRMNLTAAGKNALNFWVDHFCLCDGLMAKGDDAGGYFTLANVQAADEALAGGWGILRKIGGQYFSTGLIEIGDSVADTATKFNPKSSVLVFEDRRVNASLYQYGAVDYGGANATEFILGAKSGTAGLQGCVVRTATAAQTAKFALVGNSTNVDNFKLYGSVFFGAGSAVFPAAGDDVEVLGCSFESCGQVTASSASVSGCFFVGTTSTLGALLWNESINVSGSRFVGNTTGAGIQMPSAAGTPYAYNALLFSGNTYDVNNTSGSAIEINKNNGSDPNSYTGSLVDFLGVSVNTTITVKDVNTGNPVQYARVLLIASGGTGVFPYQESVTEIARSGPTATVTHTGHGMKTGDIAYIVGANQEEYNGAFAITYIGVDSYSYTVPGTPDTPATGTITATGGLFNEETDASGIVTDMRSWALAQPLTGRVRKGSSAPYYRSSPVTDTVSTTAGLATTVYLIPDD